MSLKYAQDPTLLAGIMSSLPKRMESSLNLQKSRLLGNLPKTRDEFDPLPLLSRLEGGEKVLVLDSKKDLPSDWRSMDLKEVAGFQAAAGVDDILTTDDGLSSESPFYDEAVKFKNSFIKYFEDVWLYGNYPPKMWNQWRKSKNLTNNHNEGYNSRINKFISVTHPNPWVLVCTLQKELLRAETEVLYLKVCLRSSSYRTML